MIEKKKCGRCGKYKFLRAKGLCPHCYNYYGRAKKKCVLCKKVKVIHAKHLCYPCYCKLFYYDKIRLSNLRRNYPGLSMEDYKNLTQKCVICEFSKIVDLHHIDGDKRNNDPKNLVGLCPNCHKMAGIPKYQEEIFKSLRKKGIM